jgi:hypothetical protein
MLSEHPAEPVSTLQGALLFCGGGGTPKGDIPLAGASVESVRWAFVTAATEFAPPYLSLPLIREVFSNGFRGFLVVKEGRGNSQPSVTNVTAPRRGSGQPSLTGLDTGCRISNSDFPP